MVEQADSNGTSVQFDLGNFSTMLTQLEKVADRQLYRDLALALCQSFQKYTKQGIQVALEDVPNLGGKKFRTISQGKPPTLEDILCILKPISQEHFGEIVSREMKPEKVVCEEDRETKRLLSGGKEAFNQFRARFDISDVHSFVDIRAIGVVSPDGSVVSAVYFTSRNKPDRQVVLTYDSWNTEVGFSVANRLIPGELDTQRASLAKAVVTHCSVPPPEPSPRTGFNLTAGELAITPSGFGSDTINPDRFTSPNLGKSA